LVGFAVIGMNHSGLLPAVPNESPDRKDKSIATGILIHVGGNYTFKGRKTVAGSYGCFGVYEGNSMITALTNDIVRRQDLLKKNEKGHWIHFSIAQRPNVQWNWIIDKNGKIVG
jgi:hypothetical protein